MAKFTVEGGRSICFDGRPFITIHREDAPPVVADEITHLIARCLNKSRKAKALGGKMRGK